MAANEEKGGQMVASELEAAEALAGLARCSAFHGGDLGSGKLERPLVTEATVTSSLSSQDQPIAVQQFCGHAFTTVSDPEKGEKSVQNIPSELCNTSCQSNPAKFRRDLTQYEKEARKLHRVLANRESARQTIRRRQAMYLELTRNSSDLLQENDNLKKQKELSMEKYNSLKSGNEFLKAQLARVKKIERADTQEEPTTSVSDKSCSANTSTPVFMLEQPSVVPCIWPTIIPPLDAFQSHPNFKSWPQFPMPHRQENSMGITGPATPLFVLPVPWLLSCLNHSRTLESNSGENAHQCSACSGSGYTLREDNNNQNENVRVGASNSMHSMSGSDENVVSATESMRNGLLKKNREIIGHSYRKLKDVFDANEARRRRKELMKLKNHCHPVQRRY